MHLHVFDLIRLYEQHMKPHPPNVLKDRDQTTFPAMRHKRGAGAFNRSDHNFRATRTVIARTESNQQKKRRSEKPLLQVLLQVAVATTVERIAQAAGVILRLRLPNIKITSARHSAENKRSAGTKSSNDTPTIINQVSRLSQRLRVRGQGQWTGSFSNEDFLSKSGRRRGQEKALQDC